VTTPRTPAKVRLGFAVVLLLFLGSCSANPVTGRREVVLISTEEEVELGERAAQEVSDAIGLARNPLRVRRTARPAPGRPFAKAGPVVHVQHHRHARTQRLRAARRLHLRLPGAPGDLELRGRTRECARPRDRARRGASSRSATDESGGRRNPVVSFQAHRRHRRRRDGQYRRGAISGGRDGIHRGVWSGAGARGRPGRVADLCRSLPRRGTTHRPWPGFSTRSSETRSFTAKRKNASRVSSIRIPRHQSVFKKWPRAHAICSGRRRQA